MSNVVNIETGSIVTEYGDPFVALGMVRHGEGYVIAARENHLEMAMRCIGVPKSTFRLTGGRCDDKTGYLLLPLNDGGIVVTGDKNPVVGANPLCSVLDQSGFENKIPLNENRYPFFEAKVLGMSRDGVPTASFCFMSPYYDECWFSVTSNELTPKQPLKNKKAIRKARLIPSDVRALQSLVLNGGVVPQP